jgi:hypothetical protein
MSAKMQPIKAAPSGPPTQRCSAGDCSRICEALGMSLGICHGPMDDSRGLAFTVCGGMLTDGTTAPAWIARMNGWSHEEIAAEALARDAVRRSGRYQWESLPNARLLAQPVETSTPTPKP